jgi:hypothetical protein
MTGCVEFSVGFSKHDDISQVERRVETALRKSWRRLRYDHPTLASAVEYDVSSQACKKVYETLVDGAEELEWMNKSFIVINNGQSGNDFCNSDPPVEKYAMLYLIIPPAQAEAAKQNTVRRDIVFRCYHDVIDGIGTLMLFNNLFRLAGQAYDLQDDYPEIQFGNEHHNLSPPLRTAACIPKEATSAQRDRAQLIISTNAQSANHPNPIFIPFDAGLGTPSANRRTALYLSEEETSAILQKCKEANVSATEAFHAGIVLAVADLQERKDRPWQGRYINKCLINLRAFCVSPFDTAQHAAAVYHSGSGRTFIIDVTIPAKTSPPETIETRREHFAAVVRHIKSFYTTVRSDPDHIAMVPLYYSAITPPHPTSPCSAIPPANPRPSVSISSLGIVDRMIEARHGSFALENPWVAADELSTGVGVFLATWKGRLCLSAGFNTAFHAEVEVRDFLEMVRAAVRAGLGV